MSTQETTGDLKPEEAKGVRRRRRSSSSSTGYKEGMRQSFGCGTRVNHRENQPSTALDFKGSSVAPRRWRVTYTGTAGGNVSRDSSSSSSSSGSLPMSQYHYSDPDLTYHSPFNLIAQPPTTAATAYSPESTSNLSPPND